MKPLQVGFLGLSHPHCRGRLNAVAKIDETTLTWVCDQNQTLAQAIAGEFRASVCPSPQDALQQKDTDLVVIEGDNQECERYARTAIQAGKNVLVEKPAGPSPASIQKTAELASQSQRRCWVGYHLRFSPSVQEGLSLYRSGILGEVTTARFHAAVMSPALTDKWFCDPNDRGGLVFLDFCHLLDILMLTFGHPTHAVARIRKLGGMPEHPFEDSAAFIFEFGDILAAGDCCGWEANDWIQTWDVQLFGTEGTLRIGIHPPRLELFLREERPPFPHGWNERAWPNYDGEANYEREIQDIARAIGQGSSPAACSIQEAADVGRVLERLYQMNEL